MNFFRVPFGVLLVVVVFAIRPVMVLKNPEYRNAMEKGLYRLFFINRLGLFINNVFNLVFWFLLIRFILFTTKGNDFILYIFENLKTL